MFDELPSIRKTIHTFGLNSRKSLGQHFLLDPNILSRVVQAGKPLQGALVLEVGPGPGGLTREILKAGPSQIVAIEQDERCVRALQPLIDISKGRLQVIHGDALKSDIEQIFGSIRPITIIANLPYNISTPLLIGWLEQLDFIQSMVLMFQREMADRLLANPNSKNYSRLSVLTQLNCHADRVMDLPPGAFWPPPRVSSKVVRLIPLAERPNSNIIKATTKVASAAFGQRRKMLRSSLNSLGVSVEQLCRRSGVDQTERADSLSVNDYKTLGLEFLKLLRETA